MAQYIIALEHSICCEGVEMGNLAGWSLMFKSIWLFHFSHAGPDVRLLDPPEHVPDSEVPGNHRRCNFPCRKPHAGPESSEEVRLPNATGTNGS